MTASTDLSAFVRPYGDGLLQMTFAVDGVNCGGCIRKIETALKKLPAVVDARLNFTNRRLTLAWREGVVQPDVFLEELERIGYHAYPFQARSVELEEQRQAKLLLRCLAVAGFAAMNIMLLSVSVWSGNVTDITPETRDLFHWVSALIALPAAAYAGQPFFRSAWTALRARSVNMDVPISLGVILALGMSLVETAQHATHAYFDSAVMLLFFLLCGRFLDAAVRRRTRAVAGNLAALRAESANRIGPDRQITVVPAAALLPGDEILVRPGERIAADGIVAAGGSQVDQSLVTGETEPYAVDTDAAVYAGTLNLGGALTVRITSAGDNTMLDEIERLLDKAVKAKSRYVRLADRAAGAYAPVVHATAALTLAGWLAFGATAHDAILTAIAVLIITCPCALALAIPAVQVVAAGRLFRAGVFLNAADAIERLAEVDTVVFDKTGTLTLPEPRVTNAAEIAPDLLECAARLALSSHHPLAAAAARHAQERKPYDGVVEEAGQGVRAVVDGVEARLGSPEFCDVPAAALAASAHDASCMVFRHGDRVAVLSVRQALRPDAREIVRKLRDAGLDVRMLSGDRVAPVASIAAALDIADWCAEVKPVDKVRALEQLKAQGRRVLMVGDGLNDAPALVAAHVSLSPITAADLSQAQADAVFLGERLAPVVETLQVAKSARRLMTQNLTLAVIYNAIAVPIAIAGLVTPLIAALAMSGSSLIVTLNALRLHRGAARPAQTGEIPAGAPAEAVA